MAKRDANDSGFCSKDRNAKCRGTATSVEELKSGDLPSYFAREREGDIFKALEVIETDLKLGEHIRWNVLLPVVRGIILNRKTELDCVKFLRELFSLFDRYQCRDAAVISEVFFTLLCITTYIPENIIDCHIWQLRKMFDCQILKLSKMFCMPYGTEPQSGEAIDFAWRAVRSADLDYLKQLLKCGIGFTMPHARHYSYFLEISSILARWLKPGNLPRFKNREDWKIRRHFPSESKKRMHLVFRVLEMVSKMNKGEKELTENLSGCYRLLFDSIPEIYVTSVEVKVFLEKCLPRAYSSLKLDIIEAFERFLPKLAEVPQPRSLQHLCRIRVRDTLRQNLSLPHGVSSLPLPKIVKKYIMLNDDFDSSELIKIYKHILHVEKFGCWTSLLNNHRRHDAIRSFVEKL